MQTTQEQQETKETGTETDTEVFFSLIGMYVNYDAGEWTEEDFKLIENSPSSVKPIVDRSKTVPSTQGHFGGFIEGDSRNENSTPYNTSNPPQNINGWRVWDIDETTGIVTLISAGHPETYYHYDRKVQKV